MNEITTAVQGILQEVAGGLGLSIVGAIVICGVFSLLALTLVSRTR